MIAFRDLSRPRKASIVGPPIAEAAALFILSAQEKLPETPGGDKVAHFLAYAVLGFLTARALEWTTAHRGRALVFLSFVLAALYGVSDELHQSFVPGRDASAGDALADAAGALIGSLAWVGFSAFRAASSRALPPRSPPREGSRREDRGP